MVRCWVLSFGRMMGWLRWLSILWWWRFLLNWWWCLRIWFVNCGLSLSWGKFWCLIILWCCMGVLFFVLMNCVRCVGLILMVMVVCGWSWNWVLRWGCDCIVCCGGVVDFDLYWDWFCLELFCWVGGYLCVGVFGG